MLDHKYQILLAASERALFRFCGHHRHPKLPRSRTSSTSGLGFRFPAEPGGRPNQILLHVNLAISGRSCKSRRLARRV
jgi:hypothetical protein